MAKLNVIKYCNLAFLLIQAAAMISCEKKRPAADYHFFGEPEGWHFIVYEVKNCPKLPLANKRIQIKFDKGENIIYTSSSPGVGWAQDAYYLDGRKVSAENLGGLLPWRVNCYKREGGKTILKYDEFYVGDYTKIQNHESSDHVLERVMKQ